MIKNRSLESIWSQVLIKQVHGANPPPSCCQLALGSGQHEAELVWFDNLLNSSVPAVLSTETPWSSDCETETHHFLPLISYSSLFIRLYGAFNRIRCSSKRTSGDPFCYKELSQKQQEFTSYHYIVSLTSAPLTVKRTGCEVQGDHGRFGRSERVRGPFTHPPPCNH